MENNENNLNIPQENNEHQYLQQPRQQPRQQAGIFRSIAVVSEEFHYAYEELKNDVLNEASTNSNN